MLKFLFCELTPKRNCIALILNIKYYSDSLKRSIEHVPSEIK